MSALSRATLGSVGHLARVSLAFFARTTRGQSEPLARPPRDDVSNSQDELTRRVRSPVGVMASLGDARSRASPTFQPRSSVHARP